jgi:EpsI family protein
LRPNRRASEIYAPIRLEEQVPEAFGGWTIDTTIIPVLPDPSVRAMLDALYNQVLARTYIDGSGRRVMLSIAYGGDQGSDATQSHRPEFCYSAQGFTVQRVDTTLLDIEGHRVIVNRLVSRMGSRFEPITYWMTLNDRNIVPGLTRKLQQIQIGLTGLIPDGMLVRVSTVGLEQDESFAAQQVFLNSLHANMDTAIRARYFGRAA